MIGGRNRRRWDHESLDSIRVMNEDAPVLPLGDGRLPFVHDIVWPEYVKASGLKPGSALERVSGGSIRGLRVANCLVSTLFTRGASKA